MRLKTKLWKRALSAFLSFVMVLGMIPAFDFAPEAEAATGDGTNYVSLPITVRDFAADGMLFEFNQFEDPDEYYNASPTEYDGLNAYFAKASWTERADLGQANTNGTGQIQKNGYIRYYPDDQGIKLTFDMRGLNDGDNFARKDVDCVIIKFRTSLGTGDYGNYFGKDYPFVAHRGPDATITDPVDSNAAKMYQIKELANWSDDGKTELAGWEDMVGKKDEWQYAKVSLGNTNGGVSKPNQKVTSISIYINQKQGHVDFGGMWVFDSNDNAADFRKANYEYESLEFYNGDNKGYGMLMTDENDYQNCLPNTTTNNIPGSQLIINGSWSDTKEPEAITATLNSGAKQKVRGAVIRTDLVKAELSDDRKPIYTDATVSYLQDLMKKTLPVAWERTPEHGADKAYNLYHVMGVKLYNDALEYVGPNAGATKDLAQLLREKITGDGTLEETKAKAAAGNLTKPTDIATYYDAAYYLLHYTWRDSAQDTATTNDGYGMPISAYNRINLIETTNSKGQECYVFNSGYDNTAYDSANGAIYNTQVTTMTKVQDVTVHSTGIIRGMTMPEARFDPLNSMGYGKSGNIYATEGLRKDQWKDTYYANTNYNLSLEGHAQFVYYEDSNQYFTFTGDDDVYLYINGTRVLDVGAAHSISKVSINLNDVAELCGLKDGKAYTFDFFYMERHGTAANFGIETNIKIVDPAMTTNKIGYQNGVPTGYNGYVDPDKKVGYSFELQNRGENKIEDLTFTDGDIGIVFTKDAITLNSDSKMEEMYLYLFNADGTIKEMYLAGKLTEDILKEKLDVGLEVGEKIGIYGFKYLIPAEKWVDGVFPNTVYTTAISTNGSSAQTLTGIAEWKVQKSTLVTTPFHVYDWVAKNVSQNPETTCDWYSPEGATVKVTKSELVQPIKDAGVTVPSGVNIVLCSASGNESGVNLNPNATLDSDGSITYTSTKPGLDTVYYKVKGMNYDSIVFHYDVYTYGTVNNVYVLDYGLAVELNGDEFGLRANDYLNLTQNIKGATVTVTGVQDATSNYGTFIWDTTTDPYSLKYTPNDIIDDTDSIRANIQILENGATEVTKFTGVNMYELITTAPANVVYYEENHPGITYVNTDENQWAHYETVDEDGNSVAGTEQSADQDSNYGSDPNYMEDKVGEIVSGESVGTVVDHTTLNLDTSDLDALQASGIEYLNEYMGLGGSDSNGTVNQLVVNETAEVMFFEFVGTGFEIVSRTTADEYAVINVQVQKKNDDGTYTIVQQKPVITESISGTLYQVPIISITGLERAEYRVVVKAAGSTANKTRVLYIDGIRIYGPLSNGDALEYYNPEEYQAEFFEVKQLIQNGQAIFADASDSENDFEMVTGTTLVEDQEANTLLTYIESPEEYMQIGPNNELYLDGVSTTSVIAFFLTPVEDYPDAARTLEIGAHRKTDSNEPDYKSNANLVYGSTADQVIDAAEGDANFYSIGSGSEMYYTIDVANLTMQEGDDRYLVMIGTNGNTNEESYDALALTSIKVAGYEITFAQAAILTAADEGTLDTLPIVQEPFSLLKARVAALEQEPEVEQIPVNENLTINSAALRADKVVSGKTAILTVKASAEAQTVVITDADGNVVDMTKCTRKVSGNVVTFSINFKVTGSRGDALVYTIRVYDANGLASVNTETVTVTIK